MEDPIVKLLDGTELPKSQVPLDTIYINEKGQRVKKVKKVITPAKPAEVNKPKAGGFLAKIKTLGSQNNDKSEGTDEEKGNKMLQVMDWAFEKATGNIPGFGNIQQTAQKYMDKHSNIEDAVREMIRWQTTTAATTGFVSSLGGLPSMLITLPANVAGVMAVQLRMIGGIAYMGGYDFTDEDTKTGIYLCLLGAEGGNILSKTAGQFAVKFTTASLKKLPGTVLTKINQAVGFRLFTKFGTKGLLNIGKAIPFVGGVVGGSVDAITTLGISNAAKALFLKSTLAAEHKDIMEISRVKAIINMALVDGRYEEREKAALNAIVDALSIPDSSKKMLHQEIEIPIKKDVDLSPFKKDEMYSACLISSLIDVVKVDGVISPAEKIYLSSIGKELGYSPEQLKEFF